jgi:hypothetical protein
MLERRSIGHIIVDWLISHNQNLIGALEYGGPDMKESRRAPWFFATVSADSDR